MLSRNNLIWSQKGTPQAETWANDSTCTMSRNLETASLPDSFQRSMKLAHREWCLDLVNFPPNSWLWMICTTQTCLFIIRCLGSSLQLAASASSIHLCLWYQLLSWTCSSYPKREFPSIRHNHEIRDLTDGLLTEVCSDVHIELDLQPVEGEMLTVSLY